MPRNWRDDALCAQVGPDPFFPSDDGYNYTEHTVKEWRDGYRQPERELKAPSVCNHCPVIQDCFQFGLPEQFGYWGGTTPRQRREIRVLLGVAPRVEDDPQPGIHVGRKNTTTIGDLARFGHHPDPAIDYEIECEEIESLIYATAVGRELGLGLAFRLERALSFRTEGNPKRIAAKAALREAAARPEYDPYPELTEPTEEEEAA